MLNYSEDVLQYQRPCFPGNAGTMEEVMPSSGRDTETLTTKPE